MKAYIPSSSDDRKKMLDVVGVQHVDELFDHLPEDVRLESLDVPEGLSELELTNFMQSLAQKNQVFDDIWRGAGAYNHFIPAAVDSVVFRERFVTTYTPYQAEISQGILQSIFEYQTSICELTGMAVSNASLYDGASALAEACRMTVSRKKDKVILAGNIHPNYIKTAQSYYANGEIEIVVVPAGEDGKVDQEAVLEQMDERCAAIAFQHPNYLGILEDADALAAMAHENEALVIMSVNPATLAVLEAPAVLGADIAVGEAQPLGLPLSFGGPYVGFMATTEKLMRTLPGRIVGETKDANGKRAFVLTLQAREQHIRREKASSNVCTNQALCAMRVNAFLTTIGPEGLQRLGNWSYRNTHLLAKDLAKLGFNTKYDSEFFHEFVTTTPISAYELEDRLAEHGILSGLPIGENEMLWCATEWNDEAALQRLVQALSTILEKEA